MKFIKFLSVIIISFLLLIAAVFWILNSTYMLDFTLKKVISGNFANLRYDSLKGDIFSGLKIEGIEYDGKAAGNLEFKADFSALKNRTLHIEKLKLTNIDIKKGFLESFDTNKSDPENSTDRQNLPFSRIIVDEAKIEIDSLLYKEYKIESFRLNARDMDIDIDKNSTNGFLQFYLLSNAADADADIDIVKNRYKADMNLSLKRSFLNKNAADFNLSFKKSPGVVLSLKGDLRESDFHIFTDEFDFSYRKYRINPKKIETKGKFDLISNDLKADTKLVADSDIAYISADLNSSVNLKDINETLHYDLSADIIGFKSGFSKVVSNEDLKFKKSSVIDLKIKGDPNRAGLELLLKEGEIHYKEFIINPEDISVKGDYLIKDSLLHLDADARIDSNAANFSMRLSSSLDPGDINHSLRVDLKSDLIPKKKFITDLLRERNITLEKIPSLHIESKTKEEKTDAYITIDEGAFKMQELNLNPKITRMNISYDLKTQDLKSSLISDILSNAADLEVRANASVNLSDINNTLGYTLKSEANAKEGYLKTKLETERIRLKKLSPLSLNINGDAKELKGDISLSGEAHIDGYLIKPDIKKANFLYSIKKRRVQADIKANLKSTPLNLDIDTVLDTDIDDINDTLTYHANISIEQKKPVFDINLRELGKIKIYADGSLKKLTANINSEKLKADLNSEDFDRFIFSLNTKRLHIDKIYKKAPKEFKNGFAALEARGYYILKAQKADLFAQLKSLKLSKRRIKTNRFHFTLDKDDFFLSPVNITAKDFSLSINASSKDGKITAGVKNRALNADIKFSPEPLFADVKVDIPSIRELTKEIDKLYPLNGIPQIDGPITLLARNVSKDKVRIDIKSEKTAFKEGRVENLDISAYLQKKSLEIFRFDFDTKGFDPKDMNRHVNLAKTAVITFDDENASVDMEFENLFKFKGSKKGDLILAKLDCNKLYLAAKDYGKTKLTADIEIFQSASQTAVSGDILLEETEINYESRVLDISKDPDIVIIDKSKKKKRLSDDSFIQNTFLDLHIKSKDEMIYKMEAGTIVLKPDMEVRKDFGSKVKILGKINILDGEYDFGDKRFKLKEGAIAFRGLEEINPLLDLHVEYEIEDVLIYIDILGDKRKPKLLFKSKPMMSKKDIFSYLLFGFAVSESDGAQSSAANAAEKIFGRALAKDLARELNLDRLDLTREEGGGINIKAGKKVNKKTIIYYQNRSQQSSIIVERKVGKHFLLDTEIGQDSQAVDLIYKKGYK